MTLLWTYYKSKHMYSLTPFNPLYTLSADGILQEVGNEGNM